MGGGLFAPAATLGAFLFAYPALFSIVNPIGGALIFAQVTADRSHAERLRIAWRVGVYSMLVVLVSLWAGGYVLNFFGITLGALRIAGGLVVAAAAWRLLFAAEEHHAYRAEQAAPSTEADDPSFFPLTIPFTTGPGTIAVAIALSGNRPGSQDSLHFFAGLSLAGVAIALSVWIAYRFADQLTAVLGETGARILSRLVAFLLLCIGVQIACTGVLQVVRPLLAGGG